MTAGRKPVVFEAQEKPVIDDAIVHGELIAARQFGELQQVVSIDQMRLSEWIGVRKGLAVIKKLADVSDFKMLSDIKESKLYKGLQVFDSAGKVLTVSTWDQFCESQGMSRQHVDECIANLASFGEEFLEATSRMGIGFRDLRRLRQLPDEAQETIINGEAVRSSDRETLIDLIEEQAIKHQREKEALNKSIADTKAELAANKTRQERDAARINSQEEEISRLSASKPARTPAMEEEERLRFMVDHSLMLVRETQVGLRSHFALLEKLFPDGILPNHVQLAMQQACTQVIQAARVLSGDYGITLKLEDNEPQELLWLTQGEKLFGAASPAEQADDTLLDGEGEA